MPTLLPGLLLVSAALANPIPVDESRGCRCKDDKESPSAASPVSWAAGGVGTLLLLGLARRPARQRIETKETR